MFVVAQYPVTNSGPDYRKAHVCEAHSLAGILRDGDISIGLLDAFSRPVRHLPNRHYLATVARDRLDAACYYGA